MQLKNQNSGNKTVCGLSIIFILKGIMTFYSQRVHAFFLNENINFNKNGTESKKENPARSFRETNLVLQLIQESQIKNKTVMSRSLPKKKEGIFCTIYFIRTNFFNICFISIYSLLNILPAYTYFTYQKHYFIHFFACF